MPKKKKTEKNALFHIPLDLEQITVDGAITDNSESIIKAIILTSKPHINEKREVSTVFIAQIELLFTEKEGEKFIEQLENSLKEMKKKTTVKKKGGKK